MVYETVVYNGHEVL